MNLTDLPAFARALAVSVWLAIAAPAIRSLAADDDRAKGVMPFPTSSRAEFDGMPLQLESSWREPEPMRYCDGGPLLKNPVCPAPVFRLERGDYVLLFNNNDGFVYGSTKRWGQLNRRPAFLCRGEFREDAHQPIWYSDPILFIDNAGKSFRGRLEAAPYVSITEIARRRVL
jgi:hypothetical protein